jgi:anti-sigma regulatory factor (Ser/Thr protein kinase)
VKIVWTHEDSWEAAPASVALARGFVTSHLERHDLLRILNEVRLVASELATNAVRHAQTPFSVSLAQDGTHVRLAVRDGSARLPLPAQPDALALGGRGLFMVATYSTAWGVTPEPGGGKSVWATFTAGA